MRTIASKGLGPAIPGNLYQKLNNPLILNTKTVGQIHTYDDVAKEEMDKTE
jgi:hypothetical protein